MVTCIAKAKEFVKTSNKKPGEWVCYDSPTEQRKSELEEYLEISMRQYKQSVELHESERKIEADRHHERASRLTAQAEQYDEAIDILENIASRLLNCSFFKLEAKRHLFSAILCRLCRGDDVEAMTTALERYQELDSSFCETWCKFSKDFEDSNDIYNVLAMFRYVVEKFNSVSPISWTTNLLPRVKAKHIEKAQMYKQTAKVYESENNVEKAIENFKKAAEFFQSGEEVPKSVECYEKIALLAVQVNDYSKAIEMFEKNVKLSLSHSLFKHKVKTHLYNAGICRLCRGDAEKKSSSERYRENEMIISLKRYQELDSSFHKTWQCDSLKDFAYSIRERNLAIFGCALNKTPADSWIANLLSRVEVKLRYSIMIAKSVRTRRST